MSDRLAELKAFIKAADHRTLSAAARALDRSPSAISKLIKRMESRLGVRLINRTSRAFSLTPEGELLYREGQKALDIVDEAERAASVSSPEVTGILRIGTSIQIALFYLAPLVPRLRELHPQLELQFVLKGTTFSLVENQIDVAVFAGEQPMSSYVARRIAPVQWVVCASPEYLERMGTPQSPHDLLQHECLNFLPGADQFWPFLDDGKSCSISPSGSIRANSPTLLRTFAIQGLGIARVPGAQIRAEIQNGAPLPILQDYEDPTPEWLYAVYQSAKHLSPRAVAFLKILDSTFRSDLQHAQ